MEWGLEEVEMAEEGEGWERGRWAVVDLVEKTMN